MAKTTPRDFAYGRWGNMIARCTDPLHPSWRWYGGRGITVCDEWLASFDAYYAYIGDRPAPGMSVDRIDNDKGYEPGNVRWATWSEQSYNRRDFNRLKTHCKRGHPFDEANTYRAPGRRSRSCRACERARQQSRGADPAAARQRGQR